MWNTRRPRFLLAFDPFLCSESLNVPCSFVKYMEGRAQGTTLLVGPSGNSWYTELNMVEKGLFLNEGWTDFVRDHHLEQGDAMIFRYDGDLQFTVRIFDRSMCEKETAFAAQSSQTINKYRNDMTRKRDRERLALLDSVFERVPKKTRCSQMQCASTSDDHGNGIIVVSSAEEWTRQADGNVGLENDVTLAFPLTAVRHEIPDSSMRSRTTKFDMLLSASEADSIARSFQSSYPNFSKVMKRFNISGSYTLNVPYQFATEYLPKCKVKILLRNLKGESWTVNSIPTTRIQTSHTFCGGWLSFVRDNSIGVGDICIFELLCKFELQVRIIRVGKDGIDGRDGESANNGGKSNGRTKTPNKTSRRNSKKISASVIKGSSQSNNCIAESEVHKRYGFIDKQGPQTKGCMSMKSAPEEKMAAQYFVSSFPHFVRVMKKFNISGSYTLKIPYRFSTEHLPDCKAEIILRNLNGECWTVNSIPSMKVQTLHTFCGGWMAFVRDNDIQMGDICIFELVGKCEMRVHICGIGKKGLNYPKETKCLSIP